MMNNTNVRLVELEQSHKEFTSYVIANSWYCNKTSGTSLKPSFTMYTGGNIVLKDHSNYRMVFEQIGDRYKKNHMVSLSELTPRDNFRLAFDFDSNEQWDENKQEKIAKCTQNAISKFFLKPDTHVMFVSVKHYKNENNIQLPVKNGKGSLHIVFPKIIVNDSRMKIIRTALVNILNHEIPLESDTSNWNDIVDRNIYFQNKDSVHLRPNYNIKVLKNKTSDNTIIPKELSEYVFVYNEKMYDLSYYALKWVYQCNGCLDIHEINTISGNVLAELERTCITNIFGLAHSDMVIPPTAPIKEIINTDATYMQNIQNKKRQRTQGSNSSRSKKNIINVERSDTVFQTCEEIVNNHTMEWYRNVKIQKVCYYDDPVTFARQYYVDLEPTSVGARLCPNRVENEIGIKQHTSRPVYFTIHQSGISQGCRSKKHGCDKFHTKPKAIPIKYLNVLFPLHVTTFQNRFANVKKQIEEKPVEKHIDTPSSNSNKQKTKKQKVEESSLYKVLINELKKHKNDKNHLLDVFTNIASTHRIDQVDIS